VAEKDTEMEGDAEQIADVPKQDVEKYQE